MKRPLLLTLAAAALLAVVPAQADPVTLTVSPATGTCYRNGTSVVTSGWFNKWTSTGSPTLTLQTSTGSHNNITVAEGGLTLAEGSATTYTYTLAVPAGYLIQSVTAQVVSTEGLPTVSLGGQTLQTTATPQTLSVQDLERRSVDLTLTSTTQNAKATFTQWEVTVVEGDPSGTPNITFSTEGNEHWYYITSASTRDYCRGQVWAYNAETDRMGFAPKALMPSRVWSFWKNDEGRIAIRNYNGTWVGTAGAGTGNNSQFGKAETPNHIYSITAYGDGNFTIGDGGVVLHAQQAESLLVRWAAEPGGASLWNFEKVDLSQGTAPSLSATLVQQGKVTTGIGNRDVPILRATLTVGGLAGSADFQGLTGRVRATNLSDVTAVRAYFATNPRELFIDRDNTMSWREQTGTLYAEGTLAPDGTYTITGNQSLAPGTYYLWLALDIAQTAQEGNTVDATITAYTLDGQTRNESNGDPQFAATIFLTESAPIMPMDMGSLYYRIPAITATADGRRLVALTDDRVNHNGDLPAHVWLVAQYSDDNGRTWSQPKKVAGTAETGGNYGHGDAQIITNRINGDIIGIMTSSPHGTGFWASTPDRPQAWKVIISKDRGETWSEPVDHTASLYGAGSPNPTWWGGFSGSGAGLQKRDGTLVSPFVNRQRDAQGNETRNYYSFFSKDGGLTWQVHGTSGTTLADEPKILERNNGDLAISVRATGYNYTNTTTDDGLTWKKPPQTRFTTGLSGNACDGEYMVWCSTLDGNARDIAFQTLPNHANRQNLCIALSEDEGETFGEAKTICPRGAAYSAATVLPDGTLGVYYEEQGLYGTYTLRFVRFSLNWASNGRFSFTEEQPFRPIQTMVNYTMPDYGWNTIVLPWEAELPAGLTAYACNGRTKTFIEEGTEYTGILLEPLTSGTLQAQTPYVLSGTPGTYTFSRPLSAWQKQEMPTNCEYKAGALVGHLVSDRVTGDGETLYNNFRNIPARGGVGFNRITAGNQVQIAANTCYVQLPEAGPLTLRPLDETISLDCISCTTPKADAADTLYQLNGQRRQTGQKGLFVSQEGLVLVQ